MAENKTKPTDLSVEEFLNHPDQAKRKPDLEALIAICEEVTGFPPVLWGKIVGFGKYHYKYASGHDGDSILTGFASRKAAIVLYASAGLDKCADELAILGKYKRAGGCLHINKITDVDTEVLKKIIATSVAAVKEQYPDN